MSGIGELPTAKTHTKEMKNIPELIPKEFPSVHVDRAMVGINRHIDTVTLTLLALHVVPNIGREGWGLENVKWEVVAEVKMPMRAFSTLAFYYIQQISGGLDILPIIQKYQKDHPKTHRETDMSYGPTDIRRETQEEKPEVSGEQT